MNDTLREAVILALLKEKAGERALVPTPEKFAAWGLCPQCSELITPTNLSFKVETHGKGKSGEAAVTVCGGCLTPVICWSRGEFKRLSNSDLKRLPRESQEFLRKEREMHEALKKGCS